MSLAGQGRVLWSHSCLAAYCGVTAAGVATNAKSFSNVTNMTAFQPAIRKKLGKKPLYRARGPSVAISSFSTCAGVRPIPVGLEFREFMTLVLMTSTGEPTTVAQKPAMHAAVTCISEPSLMPISRSFCGSTKLTASVRCGRDTGCGQWL